MRKITFNTEDDSTNYKSGYFHKWLTKKEVTFALIEDTSGNIHEIKASNITFRDSPELVGKTDVKQTI